MEAVKGSQLDRCGQPLSGLPREPPGVRAPLQLHHRRLGQHSSVHSSAVVGDPWRPDSHLPTPAPPPLPFEGAVRWCALRAPRTNGAVAPHPGTFPGRSHVPFVNRPFESEINGTVNFTQFGCVLLVT